MLCAPPRAAISSIQDRQLTAAAQLQNNLLTLLLGGGQPNRLLQQEGVGSFLAQLAARPAPIVVPQACRAIAVVGASLLAQAAEMQHTPAAGWGGAPLQDPAGFSASYLDFLQDELVVAMPGSGDPLDSGTIAAAASAQGPPPAPPQRKRPKKDAEAGEAGSADDDLDGSDDEEEGRRSGRKGRPSTAAQTKATREKARREKINDRCDAAGGLDRSGPLGLLCGRDGCSKMLTGHTPPHRFTELARLVDPTDEPKTDKLSILSEAIRFVQQMQVENCQLRQLNKFLEVRRRRCCCSDPGAALWWSPATAHMRARTAHKPRLASRTADAACCHAALHVALLAACPPHRKRWADWRRSALSRCMRR